MRRLFHILLCCLLAPSLTMAEARENITILADQNLLLPLSAITRAYAKSHQTPVFVTVIDPDAVESAILQGIEAHLLLTSDTALIDRLVGQGLTDVTSNSSIGRVPLALVSSSKLNRRELLAKRVSVAAMLLATGDIPIYLEAKNTAAGSRAAALFTGYEFSNTLKRRTIFQPTHAELIDALTDEPSLAITLASDVIGQPDIAVLGILPGSLTAPVDYRAVVLASESMNEAREFARFLASPQVRELLAHFSFQPPESK